MTAGCHVFRNQCGPFVFCGMYFVLLSASKGDTLMFWHVETDFVCLMILCTLHYDISRHDFSSPLQDNFFRLMTEYAIFSMIVDIFTSIVLEMPVHEFLSLVSLAVYFALLPSFPLVWFCYTWYAVQTKSDMRRCRTVLLFAAVPYFIYSVFALFSPLFDLIFILGDDFRYAPGPYFWGCFYVFFGYNALTLAMAFLKRKNLVVPQQFWILVSFPILTAIGVWAQLAYPGMLTITAAYTVALVAGYYHILNRRADVR